MDALSLTLTLHGVRGSAATAGAGVARFGGNTTCFEVAGLGNRRLIFDCGTGLRRLQHHLPDPGPEGFDFSVFFTHYHWDHVQGLPFFMPVYDEDNQFAFRGRSWNGLGVADAVEGAFRPPWFPVALADTPSGRTYEDLGADPVDIGPVLVTNTLLHHPQGVTAYRLDHGDRSVVIATDCEAGDPDADDALATLAQGCDVLLHDAQYTRREYEQGRRGWGHSTWEDAVAAARRAGAGRLVLVSHDPDRDDAGVEALQQAARREFPATDAGYEGMTIPL